MYQPKIEILDNVEADRDAISKEARRTGNDNSKISNGKSSGCDEQMLTSSESLNFGKFNQI